MLAYEDHFRVLWVHFEVRPSEKGSEMKLKGGPKWSFIEAPMWKAIEEQLKTHTFYQAVRGEETASLERHSLSLVLRSWSKHYVDALVVVGDDLR